MASDPRPDSALQNIHKTGSRLEALPEDILPPATPLSVHAAGILERVSDGFVVLDRAWRIVYANRQACRINRKPLEEFQGRTLWEEWPAALGTEVERRYRTAMADQQAVHFEYCDPAKSGKAWLEIDAYPSESGLDVFYRDITARKRAEEELQTFKFLSENAGDPFFLTDAEARIVYVNAAACRSLGCSAETLRTLGIADIDPSFQGVPGYRALLELARRETLLPFETIHRRTDGTVFPVEISASVLDVGGQSLLFSNVRDITERRRAEEERLQVAARQRIFLRDVLASVTDGHLILCDSPGELPPPLTPFYGPIALTQSEGLWELRQRTREACETSGLSSGRCYDLISAVSEAGMNAIVHVGHGTGQVFTGADSVQVCVTDKGTGIALEHLPHATLRKGFTTAGTLGHGMKMMLQMADRVFLLTGAAGTTVVMEQGRIAPPEDW